MRSPVGITVPLLNNARVYHGVRLVFHEVDLLPLGLLVNELGGVPETAQWLRLEGAQGVNGRELEGAQNAVGGLLRMSLLRGLAERARIAVLNCPGVVDTVAWLLPQDVQALAVDVPLSLIHI